MVVENENLFSITTFSMDSDKKENVFINVIINRTCELNLIHRLLKIDISEMY